MKTSSIGSTIIYLLTLLIFAGSIYFISERNSNILLQIKDEFKKANQLPDSSNIDKQVLTQLITEVKYFNEILNREQNDTLSYIVYIIAFFSIVAGFFGYRTIKDIRESVKEESKKITEFYEKTFSLLNDQARISKDFYDLQYKSLNEKVKEAEIELKRLVNQYSYKEAETDVQIQAYEKETQFLKKQASEEIQRTEFKGE